MTLEQIAASLVDLAVVLFFAGLYGLAFTGVLYLVHRVSQRRRLEQASVCDVAGEPM
jgi:hypothetical protein